VNVLADLRFRRLVAQVHALGPRVMAEFLAELGAERTLRTPIEIKLERFAALDPVVLQALAADRFACVPIHLVQQGDKP
jgi:hypothetical protein